MSLHGGYRETSNNTYEHIPATAQQIESGQYLVRAINQIFNISATNCWGHGEIQNNRMKEEALVLAEWCRESGDIPA